MFEQSFKIIGQKLWPVERRYIIIYSLKIKFCKESSKSFLGSRVGAHFHGPGSAHYNHLKSSILLRTFAKEPQYFHVLNQTARSQPKRGHELKPVLWTQSPTRQSLGCRIQCPLPPEMHADKVEKVVGGEWDGDRFTNNSRWLSTTGPVKYRASRQERG